MSLTNRRPTYDGVIVTKSDTVDIPGGVADGLMCYTTTGDIAVITALGDTITLKSVPLLTFIPLRISRIMSTNTAATGLLAMRAPTW